jgi:DNA-binding MarR family transcriptional regulator
MAEEPSTAVLMFVAHRDAESTVHDALRASGFDDLTAAQVRLAQRLSPHGIRVTDLAEQARVTKQTAGALVDELQRAGYVERRPDPADARARLVVLTERGRRLCSAAANEVTRIEHAWRAHLGPQAFDQLRTSLVALREITDPYR